jgi:succinoglycan biosynthesis transport protein ExoP
MDFTVPQREIHQENYLLELLGILKRRWVSILVSAVACLLLAIGWSHIQVPVFESTATVLIEAESPDPLEKARIPVLETISSPDYYETQVELLKSHRVLEKAALRLKLAERPEYTNPPSGVIEKASKFLPRTVTELLMKEEATKIKSDVEGFNEGSNDGMAGKFGHDMLRRFQERVQVRAVRGTRLARITARSNDRKFAAEIANTVAEIYIELNNEVKGKAKENALQWFSSNLNALRTKVEESEQALYGYRAKRGVVDVHDRQTMAAQRLAELNSELVKAEIKRAEAQSRYQQIAGILGNRKSREDIDLSKWDDYSEVLTSPLIQTLRAQEIKVSGEMAELADKYGPLHPKMARVKSELQNLQDRIRSEVEKIYSSLKHDRDAAVAREEAIKAAVDKQKQAVTQLEQHQVQYAMLDREAKSNQQIYDLFLRQMKESSLASAFTTTNVFVADPAVPAGRPVKPRRTANAVVGILVGFMFGIALSLWLEHRDRSVKGPHDLTYHFPAVALLGVIPRLPRTALVKRHAIFQMNSSTPAAESFRAIRTSLLLPGLIPQNGSILITSPSPGEGKSMLAMNLALALAHLDEGRILLLDADLRKPRREQLFPIAEDAPKGLVHFLLKEAEFHQVVHQTYIPNLWLMPPGKFPPNQSELLHSVRMRALLKYCREEGFLVIVDSPPVIPFSDPVIIGSQVDGVLMVVSAGETTRESCRVAAERITQSGGRLLGIIIQKATIREMPPYYRYGVLNGSEQELTNGKVPVQD